MNAYSVILVFCTILGCSSIIFNNSFIALLGLICLIFYFFAERNAIYDSLDYFSKVLDNFPFRFTGEKPKSFGLSKNILTLSDKLVLSSNLSLDKRENEKTKHSNLDFDFVGFFEKGKKHGKDHVIDSIVSYLHKNSKASTTAILIKEENFSEKIYIQGTSGNRLKKILVNIFDLTINNKNSKLTGLKDVDSENVALSSLKSFAFEQTVTFPITWKNGQGIIWLGYEKNSLTSQSEFQSLKSISSKIEEGFRSHQKLFEIEEIAKTEHKKSTAKSEFIAHATHDIKSLLNNIKGVLSYSRISNMDEDLKDLFEIAQSNCDSLSDIVEAILDFSKHSAGELRARKENINFLDVTSKCFKNFQLKASEKNINFTLNSDLTTAQVYLDRTHLTRIISNLVSNAIKYTNSGTITLNITKEEDKIILKVKDSGCGMSKEQLEKLFDPFSRFNEYQAEGIGLGMTLTKILVELNSGQISVNSELGNGSEFYIKFQESLSENKEQKIKQNIQYGILKKVVLVDDDPDSTQILEKILKKSGLEVYSCNSVESAISVINFSKPDFVITDSNMPNGGGKAVAKFCNKLNSKLEVFVVSGDEESKLDTDYKNLGIKKVFGKPLRVEDLLGELS